MKSYKQVNKELLKDIFVYKASDRFEPGFSMVTHFIQRRIERNLTQAQLAKHVQTSQAAIARFESGMSNPTVQFLFRLARALDVRLEVRIS